MTANEACCVCGGGAPTAGDVALTSDGYIVTNNLYGCPASYEPIPSQTACQSAGDNLGLDLTVEGLLGDEVDPGDPTGCWAFGSSGSYVRLLWNGNGTMTPTVIRALRNVICQTTSAGEAPTYAPSSPSSPRLRLVVVAVVVALLLLALVVIVVIFYRRKCR
jgi:subtilase family serine protease